MQCTECLLYQTPESIVQPQTNVKWLKRQMAVASTVGLLHWLIPEVDSVVDAWQDLQRG